MPLKEYHIKRNFDKTPEPSGLTRDKGKEESRRLRFVVQKHRARRLHYDFRLETEDGVLKSWAVPKGISINPNVKRLAVLTEDHPLDYLNFEGIIPEGNYGAGSVIVWDIGEYVAKDPKQTLSQQFNNGKIEFILFGKKLAGKYYLVKTARENQWLMIKGADEFASATEDLTISRPESVLTNLTNEDLKTHNKASPRLRNTAFQTLQKLDTNKKKLTADNQVEENANGDDNDDTENTNRNRIEKKDLNLRNLSILKDSKFPNSIKPMLATPIDRPFDSKEWVFEIKWDGVRAILFLNKTDKTRPLFELSSRAGNSISHRYPEITQDLELTGTITCSSSVVLDGEIVVLDRRGHPEFQSHQKRMNVEYSRDIQILSHQIPATYYLFDILYLDCKSLENLDFVERRRILSSVVKTNHRIKISEFFEEQGISLYDKIKGMSLEGVIAKKKSSIYSQGTRSRDWLKIKDVKTQDCIVIGYTRGEGNRENYFGSLLLAAYDAYTHEQRFVGHTGSGFNFEQLDNIYTKLAEMTISKCPIRYVPYTNRDPIWIRPELVAEIKYSNWTNDRIMRAPIFLRFREDKKPEECTIEDEQHIEEIIVTNNTNTNTDTNNSNSMTKTPNDQNKEAFKQKTSGIILNNDTVHKMDKKISSPYSLSSSTSTSNSEFSNLGKVFWPETKEHPELTKGNLIEYYNKISNYILPHLRNRPLSLSRYPDGIGGKHFYHKNWDKEKPAYAETAKIHSESANSTINYLICNNKETLLWIANLGSIEIHPWYSSVNNFNACAKETNGKEMPIADEEKCGLDFPDFIVFDLDPYIYSGFERRKGSEDTSETTEPEYNIKGFKAAVNVAYHMKDLFDQLRITTYVKTSGKTGLHIYIPIEVSTYTYSQTRSFAKTIGMLLLKRYPNKITMQWDTARRKDKVFFDYNQNSKGKTIASVFSARPTTSATVSMPVRWNKLNEIYPTDFTILNVSDIINRSTHIDTWNDILNNRQNIIKILDDLNLD
ncbi:MAG TPA: non-homologous end-joining DNA ligase [Nitrososphaeraceae archaeon]